MPSTRPCANSSELALETSVRTVVWNDGVIVAVDQSMLPYRYRLVQLREIAEVVDAIERLVVRGAPVLGVVGALGIVLSARRHTCGGELDDQAVQRDASRLIQTRPTAVNLRWAIERVLACMLEGVEGMTREAEVIMEEVESANISASERAVNVIDALCSVGRLRIYTHCNTGKFATYSWGTALGAIRSLARKDRVVEVIVGETRPLLQGARLTALELAEMGLPHRVCVDSAGPAVIASGSIDCVIVGADRIAANGDVVNKIGTYGLAIAAHRHDVPFVVVAPETTVDESIPDGLRIPIEERDGREVLDHGGARVVPLTTRALNPAFDVTPAELISAIATDKRLLLYDQAESQKSV